MNPISASLTAGLQQGTLHPIIVTEYASGESVPVLNSLVLLHSWTRRKYIIVPSSPGKVLSIRFRRIGTLWPFLSSATPPYDDKGKISGFNLFVSGYHGFAQLGDEHAPVPQAFEDFPVFFTEFSSVEAVGELDLIINMHVILGDTLEPERYRLMTRIQFTSPGRGRQPGYMRSHIASVNCSGNDCIVQVPVSDYASKWELDLNSYQVHMRYLLIDSKTGYRSQFKKISFLIGS